MKNRWLEGCIRKLSDKWKDLWMTGQPKRQCNISILNYNKVEYDRPDEYSTDLKQDRLMTFIFRVKVNCITSFEDTKLWSLT